MTGDRRLMARIWTCGLVPAPPDVVYGAGKGTWGSDRKRMGGNEGRSRGIERKRRKAEWTERVERSG